jgi:hypothetical protein
MSRVISDQLNPWGREEGVDAQRSDLWIVDFSGAIAGLNKNISGLLPPRLATYYSQSVTLPDLKTKSDVIRRGSRPYQTPSWDEPLDPITMTFVLDSKSWFGADRTPYQSDLYRMLTLWRMCVRAGRGEMSSEGEVIELNASYRYDYDFDVPVRMLRGNANPAIIRVQSDPSSASGSDMPAQESGYYEDVISTDLEFSTVLTLVKCWLGSFKISELSYADGKPVTITASFYAEDIKYES